jgi:hypothetical protein
MNNIFNVPFFSSEPLPPAGNWDFFYHRNMYDTVNFSFNRIINKIDVLPYLSNVIEKCDKEKGKYHLGWLEGYTVNVYEHEIYMFGSLSKFYYGSNTCTLNRKDTQKAVEKLSNLLHIDINRAKVVRMDIATVIQVKYFPCSYFFYMGDKHRFSRYFYKNTLYYDTDQRQLIFYDKIQELADNDKKIPDEFIGNKLLRYELRFFKNVKQQLETDRSVTGKMLYDEQFYQSILQRWHDEYKSIKKIRESCLNTNGIKSPKDAASNLFSFLLQKSGQNIITEYLNRLKALDAFSDRKYYSRLKTSLNKKIALPKCSQQSEFIKELDQAIYNAMMQNLHDDKPSL